MASGAAAGGSNGSGGRTSNPAHAKWQATAAELQLVEDKLNEVNKQLESLLEEQAFLENSRDALKAALEEPTQEEVDWSRTDFKWSVEVSTLLRDVFRLPSFRPSQLEAIKATLSGRNVFCIMRTGGGKSLCYQLPALLGSEGLTVVISPLLSLISDQVFQLNATNTRPDVAAMLVGSMGREETSRVLKRMQDARSGPRIVYVTPEKVIKSKQFMATLEKMSDRLNRFVIDEAHCCSQWGHTFRADYSKLGCLRKLFPHVPIMALTATATPAIIRDVSDILEMRNPEVFKTAANRPNLYYEVTAKPASLDEAVTDLAGFICGQAHRSSGIVYCFSQKESEQVGLGLSQRGVDAGVYHASVNPADKEQVLRQWSDDKIQVVVATTAFGLGISKPDVRWVVHFSLSKSLESYYQESGRAGRDGERSVCRVMYRASDAVRQSSLVVYERSGLKNLRPVIRYAQSRLRCRRESLCSALGETVDIGACGDGCDVCAGSREARNVDVTDHACGLIKMVRAMSVKEKRATHKQLTEAYLKANKGIGLDREDMERLINHLMCEGVLKEDFSATAYSTIVYVDVGGFRAPMVERGEHRIMFEPGAHSARSASAAGPAGANDSSRKKRKGEGRTSPQQQQQVVIDVDNQNGWAVDKRGDREGSSSSRENVVEVLSGSEDEGALNVSAAPTARKEGKRVKRDREKAIDSNDDEDFAL